MLLGGCLTLVESTLGTPWELDTRGAILILEDRGMKPYQVDRALSCISGKPENFRASPASSSATSRNATRPRARSPYSMSRFGFWRR